MQIDFRLEDLSETDSLVLVVVKHGSDMGKGVAN
jgi:hypothetical protein